MIMTRIACMTLVIAGMFCLPQLASAEDAISHPAKKSIGGAKSRSPSLRSPLARVENGWSMNTDTMGVYGNYYLKRAIVAQMGLGANLPEDAIYPLNLADETGKPLDGANAYTIHFDKDATPPVDAFWSITLYDLQGFQVANPLNRFAVSSWMPFQEKCGWLARPLLPAGEPGCRQGSELAPGAERPVQPDDAALRAKSRCPNRQMEPPASGQNRRDAIAAAVRLALAAKR